MLAASDGVGRRAAESAAAGGEAEALALLLELQRRHAKATDAEAEVGPLWERMVRGKGSAVSPEDAEALLAVSPSPSQATEQEAAAEAAEAAAAAGGPGGARCDLEVRHSADLSMSSSSVTRCRAAAAARATEAWPGRDALRRAPFLREMGGAAWQPQYLLRGNVTHNLTAYLAAAAGEVSRPLAFNRPLTARALAQIHEHVRCRAPSPTPPRREHTRSGRRRRPRRLRGPAWRRAADAPSRRRLERPRLRPQAVGPRAPARARSRRAAAPSTRRGTRHGRPARDAARYAAVRAAADDAIFLPSGWAHATLNLEESLSVGGFLHDDRSLGLHFQLMHAPRGIGTLQSAATAHADWYELTAAAFPPDEGDEDNEGGDGGEAATLSRDDESFDEFSGARLKSLE